MNSPVKSPTKEELLERYKIACDLKQPFQPELIEKHLTNWLSKISKEKLKITFIYDEKENAHPTRPARPARAAWDARDAWDAWAAQPAWAARAARDARAARAAWDARDARAAQAAWAARAAQPAWAAWAARAARDARDAWAAWDAAWLSICVIGAIEANKEQFDIWLPILEAFEAGCFCFWITKNEIIVAQNPATVKTDLSRRLHCDTGPAFQWLNVSDYYIKGIYVPEYVVIRPNEITVAKIDAESNSEVRRIMMERYGFGRYLIDSGCEEVQTDDFGTIYRKPMKDADPIICVKVVNSTPEPDGSYKDYWLRVAPDLRPLPPGEWPEQKKRDWYNQQKPQSMTAHNAVASTFGLRGEDYNPEIET